MFNLDSFKIYVLIFTIFIIICIFAIKKILDINLKRSKDIIDNLEIKKNTLMASKIDEHLAKIRYFANTDRITNIYKSFLKRWDVINEFLQNNITDNIIELEDLKCKHKFKNLKDKSISINDLLLKKEEEIKKLESEILNFINKEETIQKEFDLVKDNFKNLTQLFYSNKKNLHPYDKKIENRINFMKERLDNILVLIDKDKKIDVEKELSLLDEDINNNLITIKKLPDVIALNDKIIDPLICTLEKIYNNMLKESYFFQGLNLDIRINKVKEQIEEVKKLTEELNLDTIESKGIHIRKQIEEIHNILIRENESKKEVIIILEKLNNMINKLRFDKEGFIEDWNKLCRRYEINKEQTKIVEEFSSNVLTAETKMIIFNNQFEKNQEANVNLLKGLKIFQNNIKELQYSFTKLENLKDKIKEDEIYIKEQYSQLKYIYHISKRKIFQLPQDNLPRNYIQKNEETILALEDIEKNLAYEVIDVKNLTNLIEIAQHVVIRFYKDTNMLIKAATFVEKSIIYANRYRYNKTIKRQLSRAEYLYKEGDYEDALDICLSTLENVEPGIYNKLLNAYENSLNTDDDIKNSQLIK